MVGRAGIRELDELARLCPGREGVLLSGLWNEWPLTDMEGSSSIAGAIAEPDALGDGCGGVGGGVASCACPCLACFITIVGVLGSDQSVDSWLASWSAPNLTELGVGTSTTGDNTLRFTPELPILDGKS